jgi:hypothetical protein
VAGPVCTFLNLKERTTLRYEPYLIGECVHKFNTASAKCYTIPSLPKLKYWTDYQHIQIFVRVILPNLSRGKTLPAAFFFCKLC